MTARGAMVNGSDMEMSSLTELAADLLAQAAVFVAQDHGSPGFLSRFAEMAAADPGIASRALDQALAARERAGNASLSLGPGDLRVGTTSTGARLTACALPGAGDALTASLRLVDAGRRPVAGAAIRVRAGKKERFAVTNQGGWASIREVCQALLIQLDGVPGEKAGSAPAGKRVIALPRTPRDRYALAAADTDAGPVTGEPVRWQVTAGGVDFLCQERTGGYDLTLLLGGVPADFAGRSEGEYGVRFAAWTRDGRQQDWIVPLAQRPLGLGGSLYGADVDCLDCGTILVGRTEDLLATAGGEPGDVIARSIRHSDAGSAWVAVFQRMPPGGLRAVVESALAERENDL